MTDRQQTRTAILDAARGLAASHGPDGFTLLAVGRAAGVSHTTVYNHFESRTHILQALADEWNGTVLDDAEREALAGPGGDAAGRIRRLMLAMCRAKCMLQERSPRLAEAYLAALDANPLSRDLYLSRLADLIAAMLAQGRATHAAEAGDLARALLIATAKFRHAAFIRKFGFEELAAQLDQVFDHIVGPLLAKAHVERTE